MIKYNIYCNKELVAEIEAKNKDEALHLATIGAKWDATPKDEDDEYDE